MGVLRYEEFAVIRDSRKSVSGGSLLPEYSRFVIFSGREFYSESPAISPPHRIARSLCIATSSIEINRTVAGNSPSNSNRLRSSSSIDTIADPVTRTDCGDSVDKNQTLIRPLSMTFRSESSRWLPDRSGIASVFESITCTS